jgi:acetyl esterase/lipase
MVLNTLTVGAAVTPTVLKTYGEHVSEAAVTIAGLTWQYLGNRKSRKQKPTAHISYDEGLHLIRAFLQHASRHTVEEVQAFTAQWVPSPRWVRTEDVIIPEATLAKAANALITQLGHKGVDHVGGKTWWQWRRNNKPLKAEWIEMRSDYNKRKKAGEPCKRVMLYVHGGAYFFGSVDEHRYQMQRHARKLKARVFAPRYRLAPQFPFPCGLHDCLAAYMYLLTVQDPSTILLAGDSAGGGMIVSLMVTLRDQGLPLPAGAILISPWVDLTHSFPSVAGNSDRDYIPETGFFQRPSAAWPPPNADDMKEMSMDAIGKLAEAELPRKSTHEEREKVKEEAVQGFSVTAASPRLAPENASRNQMRNSLSIGSRKSTSSNRGDAVPAPFGALSIEIDGQIHEIKDQIQMYTTNTLLAHPLVSPILQPSLGGLPPILIQVGGGEMLRDEQIYLAHKAANPAKYAPPNFVLREFGANAEDLITKHKPTEVQLQVWDDLCHVAPTLSFTRPAKFMYRSIAQFGAWALAHAQSTEIDILDDDDLSVISTGSDTDSESDKETKKQRARKPSSVHEGGVLPPGSAEEVGRAGDPLPPFKGHMIRQRIDRHGMIHPLGPLSSLAALQLSPNEIGTVKAGTVRKWLNAKQQWEHKYAKDKRHVQKQRTKQMAKGFHRFGNDEVPPPSALAGRISKDMPKEQKTKRSLGMSLWSLWGSSHDKETVSICRIAYRLKLTLYSLIVRRRPPNSPKSPLQAPPRVLEVRVAAVAKALPATLPATRVTRAHVHMFAIWGKQTTKMKRSTRIQQPLRSTSAGFVLRLKLAFQIRLARISFAFPRDHPSQKNSLQHLVHSNKSQCSFFLGRMSL